MAVLRSKDIKKLDDVIEALDMCEEHGVPVNELETFEEIKERLWIHYTSNKNGSVKERIQNIMQKTGEEDQKKRRKLIEMFEELIQIVGTTEDTKKAELIKDLLQREQTSENLQEDCNTKAEGLRNNDCVILVAGETSAGKSSFLNLLLGSEYLPTHTCSCTSAITTLRYGTTAHANIIYGGEEQRVVVIEELDKDGMASLYDVTFMKGNERETGHNVKEVQVFLPAEFLKCGIVLADTPGIGENEFLETYLMDFISNNEILGFIYIIFSDAAGGVQQDRLLMLLKLIIDQQKKNSKAIPFDPKTALFLANKFDNIPEDSRGKVRDHIIKQLGKYWPEFDESMVVFFSTKKAMRDVTANQEYINDQYKHLLEGLSNLYKEAMDSRIRSSYRWIETVLKRISHFLKAMVTRIGWTQKENRERSDKQRKKLHLLHEKSNIVIAELHADIDVKRDEIVNEIKHYLSTPQARYLLCTVWKENEIPKLDEKIRDHAHWEWIKQRIDEAFYDRLCNAVEEYNEDKCKVSTIEAEIIEQIKTKLGILQGEISEVEGDLSATKSSNGSNGPDPYSNRRIIINVTGVSTIDVPIRLALNLQHRVAKNPFKRLLTRGSSEKFAKNPKLWAQDRAKKLMAKLLKDKKPQGMNSGVLTMLVERLLQRPRDIFEKIQLKIPSIIEANLTLLQDIEEHVLSNSRVVAKYEQMMVHVELLKQTLMSYGEGYIFVNDFKLNEIKVVQDVFSGGSIAQTFRFSELVTGEASMKSVKTRMVPQGLWSVVRQGLLQHQSQEKKISIKMYMPSSGVSQTFQEVAKLRCLLHTDVYLAEFLGIHHTEAVIPAYIFDGHFLSLERFFLDCSNPGEHKHRVFRQIAEGLHYLHSKGMVHIELTTSTVTLTNNGEVRLTGASVPRHAALPLDQDQSVCNFVYLSPEVLNKELYITSADVYGFGILIYEIACETKAFKEQRTSSFKEFVDKLNPLTMLFLDTHAQTWMSARALDLVKNCVEISENRRPNMNVVIEMLEAIKDDFKRNYSTRRHSVPSPGQVFRMSRNNGRNAH